MPPYLAGRQHEIDVFLKLLQQSTIVDNLILTGLRGVGKTVLLDSLKPLAIREGWLWVGTDLSESASLTEERCAIRLLTDLSVVTAVFPLGTEEVRPIGFVAKTEHVTHHLGFDTLKTIYDNAPGMVSDKLKQVLELVWRAVQKRHPKGIVFAYDEAQTLSDHADRDEFPTSVLLDVFQSIQKKGIPFMLVLAGLPTLFPKLVEVRTFAERMFHVEFLDKLTERASRDAILKPVQDAKCPVKLTDVLIGMIVEMSKGYPYFIQFVCREVFDFTIQQVGQGNNSIVIPMAEIARKLDTDFFAGRWARATDRQRDLLRVAAELPNADEEFTVQEVVERSSKILDKPFSSSHANQMLSALGDAGLVYKNRHGKYSFAVPLLGDFILRQSKDRGEAVVTEREKAHPATLSNRRPAKRSTSGDKQKKRSPKSH
jgi:hypothetical protein